MTDFSKRSNTTELLDRDDIPFHAIERNMKELDFINAKLGGHRITIEGFKKLYHPSGTITICEIGCGGGDNLTAIHNWCVKHHLSANFIGIDINPNCIAFAKQRSGIPGAVFIASDYKQADFGDKKPDIIFSSLFCHHFTNNQLVEMLQWMKTHSTLGFFINDLQRHPLAYYSIQFLTRLFSRSYLVRNDAPLSVLRGFKKQELSDLFAKAGISGYAIEWKWAFRYLAWYTSPTVLNQ